MPDRIKDSFLSYYEANNAKTKAYYASEVRKSFDSEDFRKAMDNVGSQMKGASDAQIKTRQDQMAACIMVDSLVDNATFLDAEKDMFSKMLDYAEKRPGLKRLESEGKAGSEEYNRLFLEELFKTIQSVNRNFMSIFKFVPTAPITDGEGDFMPASELAKQIDASTYAKYSDFIRTSFGKEMKDVRFNKDCIDVIRIGDKAYYIKNIIFGQQGNPGKADLSECEIKSFPFICY